MRDHVNPSYMDRSTFRVLSSRKQVLCMQMPYIIRTQRHTIPSAKDYVAAVE